MREVLEKFDFDNTIRRLADVRRRVMSKEAFFFLDFLPPDNGNRFVVWPDTGNKTSIHHQDVAAFAKVLSQLGVTACHSSANM
jgi:hypothetical protein